jgi:tetratricopeptide (TPR) repeat protein
MDQDKFDHHLMDYLFDELDEVTRAAMKRKIESDAECRALEAGLRATIEVAQLPTEEPDPDLEERILLAAELAQQREPWTRKITRSLSWAGSRAMNRQLAMAAVLMLVLGSAVLFLRPRPGSVAVTPVKDTTSAPATEPAEGDEEKEAEPSELSQTEDEAQRKTANASPDSAAHAADKGDPLASASAAPPDDAELEAQFARGKKAMRDGQFAAAIPDLEAVAGSKNKNAGAAAHELARAMRATQGCGVAIPYFEKVGTDDARYELADCYIDVGQNAQARAIFEDLAKKDAYRDRAVAALEKTGDASSPGGDAVASRSRAAPPKKAAAKTEPPAAAPPPGGSGGKAKAAPAEDAYDAAPPQNADSQNSF